MNKKTVFLNVQKITYLIFYLTIYFLSNHLMKRYSWMMNNGYSIEVIFGAFRKIESKIGNYQGTVPWKLHVKKILPYFLAKKQNEDQTSSSS